MNLYTWMLVAATSNHIVEKIFRKIEVTPQFNSYVDRAFKNKKKHVNRTDCGVIDRSGFYITARINYGAGVGHQMSCWSAAYNLSMDVDVGFANIPLWINGAHGEEDDSIRNKKTMGKIPSGVWDRFLGIDGLGRSYTELLKEGYEIVRLPSCPDDESCRTKVQEFMELYNGKRVIFCLAIDQRYKGWISSERLRSLFNYDKKTANVLSEKEFSFAVHIRRGDVDASMPYRYRTNKYYLNAVNSILVELNKITDKTIRVFLVSEGREEDFKDFINVENIRYVLDLDSKKSFALLANADAVLISPSGFSAIAGALNKGMRFSPCEYVEFEELEWRYLDKEGVLMTDNGE